MINSLYIKNFKAFEELDIKLSNLNILTGLNGMGKTSLIQSLLLLRQSYLLNNLSLGLTLYSNLVKIGTSKDALYQHAEDDIIQFRIKYNDYYSLERQFLYKPDSNFLPVVDIKMLEPDFSKFSLFNNNFQYLAAEHISPQSVYQKSDYDVITCNNLGTRGEFTAHYLAIYGTRHKIKFESMKHTSIKSDSLINQVEAWLNEITPGIRVLATSNPNTNDVFINYRFETKKEFTDYYTPINVGFGITYVLPVIVSLLDSSSEKLIILENPESHLHPKGQSKIGELISLAAQNGTQIILETHSDHIINGIRVAVVKKQIDAHKIRTFYFDRDINSSFHKAFVHTPNIDSDGRYDYWPDGFLDEWDNNLMNLI